LFGDSYRDRMASTFESTERALDGRASIVFGARLVTPRGPVGIGLNPNFGARDDHVLTKRREA